MRSTWFKVPNYLFLVMMNNKKTKISSDIHWKYPWFRIVGLCRIFSCFSCSDHTYNNYGNYVFWVWGCFSLFVTCVMLLFPLLLQHLRSLLFISPAGSVTWAISVYPRPHREWNDVMPWAPNQIWLYDSIAWRTVNCEWVNAFWISHVNGPSQSGITEWRA